MNRRIRYARAIRGDWGEWDKLAPAQQRPFLIMADRIIEQETHMEEKPTRLVPDWRTSWRWWSMRLAAIASAGIGVALDNLHIIAEMLSMAPPEVRGFVPIGVSIALFVVVALVRLWRQK